jgi:hypothetical protein
MGEFKEQKIVVIITLTESDRILIEYGVRIATIFRKELCLLVHSGKKSGSIPENCSEQLETYTLEISNKNPGLRVSQLIISKSNKKLPDYLADEVEAILIITSATSFHDYSSAVEESPIPFLFIDENSNEISAFKKVMLAIDLRTENKDSALWSSYFGRFNQSEIVVVAANDHSKEGQQNVAQNIVFTKKLYKKFKLSHKIFKGTKSSLGNSFEALDLAHSSGSDLLIILGSSTITPIDRLVGLPERKIVKHAGYLPVLLVNPRRDNYILCD